MTAGVIIIILTYLTTLSVASGMKEASLSFDALCMVIISISGIIHYVIGVITQKMADGSS